MVELIIFFHFDHLERHACKNYIMQNLELYKLKSLQLFVITLNIESCKYTKQSLSQQIQVAFNIYQQCLLNFYYVPRISHITLIITFTYKLKSIAFDFSRLIFHSHQFYMIKFILERYANTNNQQQEQSAKRSQIQLNTEVNASTVALKNLKHTEDHIQALKRRLSVLAIRDQKNERRAKQNERKIEFHAKVQESISKDKKKKMKYLKDLEKSLRKSHQRIESFRMMHNQSLQEVKQGLQESKRKQYEKIKNESDSHEKNIEKSKMEDLSNKVNRRKEINEMEKLQKQHIVEYFFNKKSNFRQSSIRQGSQYESRRSQRQSLLSQLSARESQMIQRQSSSRAALEQSTRKLYKFTTVLKPLQREKSTSDFSQKVHAVPIKPNQQLVFL